MYASFLISPAACSLLLSLDLPTEKKIKNWMVLGAIMIETETKSNQTNRGTVWREKVLQMQSAPFELQFNGIWKYRRGIFALH